MIGYIKGEITFKSPAYIYIEAGGIGYLVHISLNTYSKIEKLTEVKLYTYFYVREDGHSLYGFFDEEEKTIFSALIGVSGIGTNTARLILSAMVFEEVRMAILQENVAAFSSIKGIGPKTAKRIILDLKDKMVKDSGELGTSVHRIDNTLQEEALSALIALGFPRQTVIKVITDALKSNQDITGVEDLIKKVLKQLS